MYEVLNIGGIDILVNNAGSMMVAPFATTTQTDYEAQMKLHLYAVVEAIQLIVPHFKKTKRRPDFKYMFDGWEGCSSSYVTLRCV